MTSFMKMLTFGLSLILLGSPVSASRVLDPNPPEAKSPRCKVLANEILKSSDMYSQLMNQKEYMDSGCGCPSFMNYDPKFRMCS